MTQALISVVWPGSLLKQVLRSVSLNLSAHASTMGHLRYFNLLMLECLVPQTAVRRSPVHIDLNAARELGLCSRYCGQGGAFKDWDINSEVSPMRRAAKSNRPCPILVGCWFNNPTQYQIWRPDNLQPAFPASVPLSPAPRTQPPRPATLSNSKAHGSSMRRACTELLSKPVATPGTRLQQKLRLATKQV